MEQILFFYFKSTLKFGKSEKSNATIGFMEVYRMDAKRHKVGIEWACKGKFQVNPIQVC